MLILGALHKSSKKKKLSKIEAVKFLKQATDLDSGNVDAQIEMAEGCRPGHGEHAQLRWKGAREGGVVQIDVQAGEP